jgi:hypothetical protein
VAAQFTLSGDATFTIRNGVSTVADVYRFKARLFKITHGGSDVLSLIGEGEASTLVQTTAGTHTITIVPTRSFIIAEDERLVMEVVVVPADGSTTFASTANCDFAFTSSTSTNPSLDLTETVTFKSNAVILFPRRTSTIGIGNFFDALTTRGSSAYTEANVGTRDRSTAGNPVQLTRGWPITTITKLTAVTIASTSNASSYVSPASFTPVPNRLYMLCVVHSDAAPETTVPTITTTTGLNFVQPSGISVGFGIIASPGYRTTVFRAMKASGLSTGTYTVNFADGATGCLAVLFEVQGVLTTGTDGADAIRNISTNAADNQTSYSVTMDAFQQEYHGILSFFGQNISGTPTAGAGFTGTFDFYSTPSAGLLSQYRFTAESTVVAASNAGAASYGGIAVELVAAAAPVDIEWISPRVARYGFMMTDAVYIAGSLYAMESNALAESGLIARLYRRRPDGSETLIWQKSNQLITGLNASGLTLGTMIDTNAPFSEDDRIVFRALIDKVSGNMVGGYLSTMAYDHNVASAVGDSHIILYDPPDFKSEADAPASNYVPNSLSTFGMGS